MQKSHQLDLTQGPIFTRLLQFSIPIILSGILQLLFNAADVIVVGKFAGDEALAAVGSTSSLVHLLINLFVGLATGTNVVAANFFGAKNIRDLHDTVHTAILVSFVSGIFMTVIGICCTKNILILMQATDNVLNLSALYLKIYFGGITATMVYNFGSALLRAKGDTKRPLYILLLAGLINFLLNLLFVIVFKMSVAGVGIATVISQVFAATFILIILCHENDDFKLSFRELGINGTILGKIIKVGVPAGFQGIMFSFSNVIIQSSINGFGPSVIAGSSASSNIENFVYISMNGFAQGTLTFTSQNFGAGRFDRIKKTAWISEFVVFVIGLILGYSVIFLSPYLFPLFTKTPATIDAGKERLFIICSSYFLCGIMDVIGYMIRGIGHSLLPMIVSMIGACGFRIIWLMTVFQVEKFHKTSMIYITYPLSWILTFVVELICFLAIFSNIMKKNKSKVSEVK